MLISAQSTASALMLSEYEFKEANNQLVVPAYRQFCRENGLAFHFWDELPPESFRLSVSNREFKLHQEAIELFNRLKPPFHTFRGEVVSFHFESWDGQFSWRAVSLDQFMRDYVQLQEMGRRYKTLFRAMVLVTQFALLAVLFGFFNRFAGTVWFWMVVIACIAFGHWPSVWLFEKRPAKRRARELEVLAAQLAQLRKKLEQADESS